MRGVGGGNEDQKTNVTWGGVGTLDGSERTIDILLIGDGWRSQTARQGGDGIRKTKSLCYIYINKTINSFSLVGRRGGVSVAFRKTVSPDSRELCTIREWRDFSGTYSTGLPLISAALARRDRL